MRNGLAENSAYTGAGVVDIVHACPGKLLVTYEWHARTATGR